MKRWGPRLGEARGTRMLPRARATGPPLPPGRLKWGTAASARPEGNAASAPETGALRLAGTLWTASIFTCDFEGHSAAVPVHHGSVRRVPLSTEPTVPCALCKRGPGNRPKKPPRGLRLTGLDSHLVSPRVSSEYQLLDAPASLGRGPRSGSPCRWQLCSVPFRIPAFALSGLGNTQPPT